MPSSARHLSTVYVARRVDLGIDPYGFGFLYILRQTLLFVQHSIMDIDTGQKL